MAEAEDILEYVQALRASVRDRILNQETPYQLNAFAFEFLERLSDIGVVAEPQVCDHRGGRARGSFEVHGYEVRSEDAAVDVYLGVYQGGDRVSILSKAETQTALNKITRFLKRVRGGLHHDLEPSNERFDMVSALSTQLMDGATVRVILFTDGQFSTTDLKPDDDLLGDERLELWDIVRLYRASQSHQETEVIQIDVKSLLGGPIPCVAIPEQPGEFQVYLAVVPGRALYELYEKYGGRLMELNVRSFLQARGKVNKGIRETLRDNPEHFMAYNNGISATVNHLETAPMEDGTLGIVAMKGLQIVNGGQTTASIHRAFKFDKFDLSRVHVPTKITVLREEQYDQFVPLISRYANTQNAVQMADFSANDQFHIELERLSGVIYCPGERGKWFYERARGAYQVAIVRQGTLLNQKKFKQLVPPSRKLSKTDVARSLELWEQKPHQVSKGAQKNFVDFMERRVQTGAYARPDEQFFKSVVARHILFMEAQLQVRRAGVEAYRAQVATYLVSYLAWRVMEKGCVLDFTQLWQHQGVSPELSSLIYAWSVPMRDSLMRTAGTKNVTEWCKSEKCWQAIRECSMHWPNVLPPEIRERQEGDDAVAEAMMGDLEEQKRQVLAVEAEEWERIAKWGCETGQLGGRQQQMAYTIARKKRAGWRRPIKVHQIINGAAMLRMWGEDGGI